MAALTPARSVFAASLTLAALGAAGVALGFVLVPARAAYGYLTAFCFAVSIAVGALLILLLGYAVNATWMSVVRRLCDTIALALVPLALLFGPVAASLGLLYVWAAPTPPASATLRHAIDHTRVYLNPGFFVARSGLYFVVWLAPSLLLRRWSLARNASTPADAVAALHRERGLSAAMLFPVTLALTFCAFDWLMSLQPDWLSSAYGLYFLSGGVLGGFCTITLLAQLGARSSALAGVLTPHHFHALGRCLFAFTILWTYIAYFQLFLIVLADKPSEVSFYLARAHGSWKALGPVLAVGHFVVPVLLLARRAGKMHGRFLAGVSGWLLLMHYADLYYLIMPVLSPHSALPHWCDLSALVSIVGVCTAFCCWRQRDHALLAQHDPLLPIGSHYRSEL